MRDPIGSIARALECARGGVVIVWSPDLDLLAWLVGSVASLSPTPALRLCSVEDALTAVDQLVLLVPPAHQERDVVLDLNGSCGRLFERSFPIVLFLLREGEGQRALAQEAPTLWSWTAGRDPDPERLAELELGAARIAFAAEHGTTPEAWLARWRSGEIAGGGQSAAASTRNHWSEIGHFGHYQIAHISENFTIAYQAALLEDP